MQQRRLTPLERKISPLVTLGTIVLTVAALYWGRTVLLPLALAILLTFLLNPIVNAWHRRGLPRGIAVLLAVVLIFSLFGSVAYALGTQVSALAAELPQYRENIMAKISRLRQASHSRGLERLERTFNDILGELQRPVMSSEDRHADAAHTENPKGQDEKPVPVVVKGEPIAGHFLPSALGSMLELTVTALMVVVLVVFMLLRLQDLRNRLIRLIGYSRLTTTTKALDDAAARISRYLLMQSIINATYGFCIGLGLSLMGLPYAVLLGFVAGAARFMPYVGPPLGAAIPILLSLAVFNTWSSTLLVVALFVGLELLTSMVLEPLLYGQSAGVSEVALLVAIAFWTWIWGPLGLLLATPLTVCLVVLAKYIPELEAVDLLLGDEAVLDLPQIYYQRLLARDTDEAADVLKNFLKDHPKEQLFDGLLVPALSWAKRDAAREKLDTEDWQFILSATAELIEPKEKQEVEPQGEAKAAPSHSDAPRIRVLGLPVHDAADELVLRMLGQLLDKKRFQMEVLSSEILVSEQTSAIREKDPEVICVSSLSPGPIAPLRQVSKRVQECCAGIKLLACRWGKHEGRAEVREQLEEAGANFVGTTLLEIRNHLLGLVPVLSRPKEESRSLAPAPMLPEVVANPVRP